MKAVADALEPLSPEARSRVFAWASSLYGVSAPRVGPGPDTARLATANGRIGAFDTIAEFFDAADPQTEYEKALVGGWWLQKRGGMPNFESAAVNRELKQLGHAIGNITMAFDQLMDQKPALVVQTAKAGNTKQARKKYMVTKAGEKYIDQMLGGENAPTDAKG